MSDPAVSVVIPSHARRLRLRWLLNALEEQTLSARAVRGDRRARLRGRGRRACRRASAGARRHAARAADRAGNGPPLGAAQHGLAGRARAPLVAFIDDDCRADEGWLERAAGGGASAHPGRDRPGHAPGPTRSRPASLASPHARSLRVTPPDDFAQTCNIAYPKALLERVDGFDEKLPAPAGEDTDLALRARADGRRARGRARGAWSSTPSTPYSLPDAIKLNLKWRHLAFVIKRHPAAAPALHAPRSSGAAPTATSCCCWSGLAAARGCRPALLLGAPVGLPPADAAGHGTSAPWSLGVARAARRAGRRPGRGRDHVLGQRRATGRSSCEHRSRRRSAVALLNPFFWPEVRRGSERLMHDLAVDLLRLGARPHLITSHPGRPGAPSRTASRSRATGARPRSPGPLRSIEPHLSHVPFSYASLVEGRVRRGPRLLPHRRACRRSAGRAGPAGPRSSPTWATRAGRCWPRNRLRKTILERVDRRERRGDDAQPSGAGRDVALVRRRVARDLPGRRPGRLRARRTAAPRYPTIACAGAVDDGRKRIPPAAPRVRAGARATGRDARLLLTRPRDPAAGAELTDGNPGVELVPARASRGLGLPRGLGERPDLLQRGVRAGARRVAGLRHARVRRSRRRHPRRSSTARRSGGCSRATTSATWRGAILETLELAEDAGHRRGLPRAGRGVRHAVGRPRLRRAVPAADRGLGPAGQAARPLAQTPPGRGRRSGMWRATNPARSSSSSPGPNSSTSRVSNEPVHQSRSTRCSSVRPVQKECGNQNSSRLWMMCGLNRKSNRSPSSSISQWWWPQPTQSPWSPRDCSSSREGTST